MSPDECMARRAVTLIEAVLFVSIALGLIVGGIVFYQQATVAARTQAVLRLAQGMITEGRALMSNAELPSGAQAVDLEPILIAAGAVPASAVDLSQPVAQIVSPWGGAVRLRGGPFSIWRPGMTGDGLYLRLETVPVEICARLAAMTADGEGVLGTGILQITIDPAGGLGTDHEAVSNWYAGVTTGTIDSVGLSAAQAAAACRSIAQASDLDDHDHNDLSVFFRWN